MKKQRPHKASKSGARRKARQARAGGSALVADPINAASTNVASIHAASIHAVSPDATKAKAAKARATKAASPPANAPSVHAAWTWHRAVTPAQLAPGPRAKGPPPRPARAASPSVAPPRSARTSKLSAPLIAALAERLPKSTSSVPRSSIAASPPRRERLAALLLIAPVLLAAGLLLASPGVAPGPQVMPPIFVGQSIDASPLQLPLVRALPSRFASAVPRLSQTAKPPAGAHAQSRPSDATSVAADEPPNAEALADSTVADGQSFTRPPEQLTPVAPTDAGSLVASSPDQQLPASDYARPAEALIALAPLVEPPEPVVAAVPPALVRSSPPAAALPDASGDQVVAVLPAPMPVPTTPLATVLPVPAEMPSAAPTTVAACAAPPGLTSTSTAPPRPPVDLDLVNDPLKFGRALAAAAQAQTHDLVIYNAAYRTIAYPGGDVPLQFGVCTDVVIRAYRALDIDLQQLVHITRRGASDRNIDHRRTELLRGFFAVHGEQLPVSPFIEDYLPGDIVTYYRPQNKSSTAHIALVSDVTAPSGRPMIVHNRGWGVQLEDALFVDQMTGHYRFRGLRAPQPTAITTASAKLKQQAVRTPVEASIASHASQPPVAIAVAARRTSEPSALQIAAMRATLNGGVRMGLGAAFPAAALRCDVAGAAAKSCRPLGR